MENDDLEMGMFGDLGEDFELNLDDAPEEIKALLEDSEEEDGGSDEGTESGDAGEDLNEDDNEAGDGEGSPEGVVEGDGDNEGSESSNDSPNVYSSFATVLHEQGLLPSLDPETQKIEDIDSLTKAIKAESENLAKEYIVNKLGEEGYEALEKGVTLEEYQSYQNTTNQLDSITEEMLQKDIELSKQIIFEDYVGQGMSEDRAKKILSKTIDLGEEAILEDAKESLNSLKELQAKAMEKLQIEREKQKEARLAEQEKIDNDLKNSIYSSKEIIKGIKVDKAVQDKVYESITKIVSKSPSGVMENKLMRDRREDPVNFDTKLYYLYEITNGFKDFSKLISKQKSNAIKDLESSLRQTNFGQNSGGPSFLDDPESYGGSQFGSELVL